MITLYSIKNIYILLNGTNEHVHSIIQVFSVYVVSTLMNLVLSWEVPNVSAAQNSSYLFLIIRFVGLVLVILVCVKILQNDKWDHFLCQHCVHKQINLTEKKKTLLAVFIAWLNPDLRLRPGGMDSYAKAWLQFGFKFPNLNYRTDLYPLLQV